MRATDQHGPEAEAAISAELVACTLGQRSRLELRTDAAGVFARMSRDFATAMERIGQHVLDAMNGRA